MGFKCDIMEIERKMGFKNKINWLLAILITFYHISAVYWCWNYAFPVKLPTIVFALLMLYLNSVGIICGAHRLFTHRSYKVNKYLKLFLVICYTSAGQNSIYQWVRDHRLHHKCSDTNADPHNANRGLFFSHIGWLMMKKNEDVIKQGKKIDMSDIESDKLLMIQERYFIYFKLWLCYILPTATGIYLWSEEWKCAVAWQWFIRYLWILHAELSVNSLAHAYGYTPYNKNIKPKENYFVSAVTFGEGYHNYHHVFPFDYKTSEYFNNFDFSTLIIKWWSNIGWAYDLKEANPAMVNSVINRLGDDCGKAYLNTKD